MLVVRVQARIESPNFCVDSGSLAIVITFGEDAKVAGSHVVLRRLGIGHPGARTIQEFLETLVVLGHIVQHPRSFTLTHEA